MSCSLPIANARFDTTGNGIITRRPLILQLIHTPNPAVPKNQDGSESCTPMLHLDLARSLNCLADA